MVTELPLTERTLAERGWGPGATLVVGDSRLYLAAGRILRGVQRVEIDDHLGRGLWEVRRPRVPDASRLRGA